MKILKISCILLFTLPSFLSAQWEDNSVQSDINFEAVSFLGIDFGFAVGENIISELLMEEAHGILVSMAVRI